MAEQLQKVAACVEAVERGHSLTDSLAALTPEWRPGVQALSFEVLRQLGLARGLLGLLAPRRPEPAVRALLCTALALLQRDNATGEASPKDAWRPSYSDHTLVNQAVEAAKRTPGARRQSGFINACLRRYLREADALLAQARQLPEARWNHPAWWVERLRHDHPADWQQILQASNRAAPMALRVNRRRIGRDRYAAELLAIGLHSQPFGDDGLVLERPQPVGRLPGFEQGWCSVQDAAAQLAAPLLLQGLGASVGLRVLDACAAPGGKTAHLLECADLDLLALDVDAGRCERIRDNLLRLGLLAQIRCADAGQPSTWWDGRPFDAILLDAPCTASGIVRRHPDVRWLRRPGDVEQLARAQRVLLEALWSLLRPGGRMLYATCSVFRAEGQAQVQAFLERHTDAVPGPAVGHLLPGCAVAGGQFNDNVPGGHDGFFYARIDKAGV
ncbi:16S rRNA (cytosine(967)-C(5))-methyltransferase RsmB [Hydrogenophaga sp.]|uniref:16S rRNA (cytosine(967)-C(5))-methyltransferase RsmB n=1 Tax=Hydrogenophaga sp. TaxID=1904254 RepID=UPI002C213D25|nr:16S rRNA (cytosine(967)-C(5))-methyltransferase RsmB [Hydrogenophaga sp.]HMP11526.1 16S rRNA (cytosine(967)-C(5))-methyltransferase RsmB [Hydrogenophaga sp.]